MDDFDAFLDSQLKETDKGKKRKHEKKEKKNKKEKKVKKEKKGNTSKSEEEEVWVEAEPTSIETSKTTEEATSPSNSVAQSESSSKRESWMLAPPKGSSHSILGLPVEAKPTTEEKTTSVRELNPFLRGDESSTKSSETKETKVEVGDGGRGWRAKALKRAQEQAIQDGISVEEIMTQRYGSDIMHQLEEDQKYYEKYPERSRDRFRGNRDRFRDSNRDRYRDDRDHRDRDKERNSHDKNRDLEREKERERTEDKYKRKMIPSSTDLKWKKKPDSITSSSNLSSTSASSPPSSVASSIVEEQKGSTISVAPIVAIASQVVLSEVEMNELQADILRAKLSGDIERANELQEKLEEAREAKENASRQVIVNPIDINGKLIPMMDRNRIDKEKVIESGVKVTKRGKYSTHSKEGERERYFADDDAQDLKTLVENEKLTSKDNLDSVFVKNIVRKGNYKEQSADDFDDVTMGENMWDSGNYKKSKGKQEERNRKKAIQAHNKMQDILSNCWFCFDNPTLDRNFLISLGNLVYLALPKRGTLTPGHCLIIPMSHQIACNTIDEDILEEILNFKKCLIQMFRSQNREAIFTEIVVNLQKQRHTFIECIPISYQDASQAKGYFKKAIMESESEWSQHKKLIDTTGRGIKKSIPAGFPYFFVEFSLDNSGYAHVIEDEKAFPLHFAREVVAGMLQLKEEDWLRPKDDTLEIIHKRRKDFLNQWLPFDWTQQLD